MVKSSVLLVLFLTLLGCDEKRISESKAISDAKEVVLCHRELDELKDKAKYLGKCYLSFNAAKVIFKWELSSRAVHDNGLVLCQFHITCDYKQKDKCVMNKFCPDWYSYGYIEKTVDDLNLVTTECPK